MSQADLASVLRETYKQLHRLRKSFSASGHLNTVRDIDSLVAMAESDAKHLLQKLDDQCADDSPDTYPGRRSTGSTG